MATHKEALSKAIHRLSDLWAPPSSKTIAEWSEAEMRLSSEYAAEPGRFRLDKTPYMRGPLNAINDLQYDEAVLMWAAQTGKTTAIMAALGYYIDVDPSPILMVQPTVELAQAFSRERVAPFLRDVPALVQKVGAPTSRRSGNTLMSKRFVGGHLALVGSNSPAGLASRPIRILLQDEIDRFPLSAGSEGDPVALARKRTSTYQDSRVILTSTPTVKGLSRIEASFDGSDRQFYHVPCPHCGVYQKLVWGQVRWESDKPETAYYQCEHCEGTIDDEQKLAALGLGEWVAENPGSKIAGFHLNGLYSPWRTFGDIAAEFIEAKRVGHEALRVFVNTVLAETWAEESESVEEGLLFARREQYDAQVPDPVLVVTAGVDVQSDRIEMEVVGWGKGEESWAIDYLVLLGDPDHEATWVRVEEALQKVYQKADGTAVRITAACIDSGYSTQNVYQFTRGSGASWWPIKGVPGQGKPVVGKPSKQFIGRSRHPVWLYPVGVDTAKGIVYSRFRLEEGPPMMHWPVSEKFESNTSSS
jgi:phage terminase large subunit GpA-like protein